MPAVVLFWASTDDSDRHRTIGSVAAATLALLLAACAVAPAAPTAITPATTAPVSATATPPSPPAAPPTANPSPAPPTTAEQIADRLAFALEASDFVALRALVDPAGFFYQLYQTDGSRPITPDQTIDRLRRGTNASDGRLHVTVARRPILPHDKFQPPSDGFINSIWSQYDNLPTQRVELLLKNEAGTWYWSGGLFNAPVR